jgi:hypothetical protein
MKDIARQRLSAFRRHIISSTISATKTIGKGSVLKLYRRSGLLSVGIQAVGAEAWSISLEKYPSALKAASTAFFLHRLPSNNKQACAERWRG